MDILEGVGLVSSGLLVIKTAVVPFLGGLRSVVVFNRTGVVPELELNELLTGVVISTVELIGLVMFVVILFLVVVTFSVVLEIL